MVSLRLSWSADTAGVQTTLETKKTRVLVFSTRILGRGHDGWEFRGTMMDGICVRPTRTIFVFDRIPCQSAGRSTLLYERFSCFSTFQRLQGCREHAAWYSSNFMCLSRTPYLQLSISEQTYTPLRNTSLLRMFHAEETVCTFV